MSTVSANRATLKPVSGTCRWVQFIGEDPDTPGVGLVEINGERYALGCSRLIASDGADYFTLLAVEKDRHGEERCYHLPGDLSSCNCPDFIYRAHLRPDGKCKHQKAVAKLLAQQPATAAK